MGFYSDLTDIMYLFGWQVTSVMNTGGYSIIYVKWNMNLVTPYVW